MSLREGLSFVRKVAWITPFPLSVKSCKSEVNKFNLQTLYR